MAAIVAAIAGTAAAAAYADAKFHIRSDLTKGSLDSALAEAQKHIMERMQQSRPMLYHTIEAWAKEDRPNHLFLEYQGRSWTYTQFYNDLQRVGNWLMNDLGIQKKEMVALNGPNSAEYLLLWFAMEGIGACVSYINHNLTGNALTHSVKLCDSRYVLCERETADRVEPCRAELEQAGLKIVYYDETLLSHCPDTTSLPKSRTDGFEAGDIRSLIYTSGTTGLPKGVIMTTGRTLNTSRSMAKYLKLTPNDKFYTCLPLYHGAAQGLCTQPVIHAGASMCLGRKFSHKTFWPEVSESRANCLQYVGELCRYLVNSPPHPLERKHNVLMAWGNGMRPDVWEKFRERFGIPVINELYAATDGLGSTFNRNCGEFGRSAIGVRGLLWNWRMGGREVRARIDPDTEEIVKDADGWVVKCGVNEPGEVIHKVDPIMAEQSFRGYFKNEASTQKRWMRNVFEPGDLWFRSGDVMRQDADGRVYFVDRLGDTFRWKSENVSTNEVADILGSHEQIAETNVYGVAVPNADGRCGCATVVLREGLSVDGLNCESLAQHVLARLPRYAVPVFLRVSPQLTYTGTFKIQKGQAKREGVDIDLIEQAGSKDKLYWLPPTAGKYEPYTRHDWEALRSGQVRL